MKDSYLIPLKEAEIKLTEKKSVFIGYIKNVATEEEALGFLNEIRKKNNDATHNAFAYRIRKNNLTRFSDDGEPAKTAGAPVMDVILNEDITDVIIVVTRYFGGTLLGTGGLVKAYQGAAKEAVKAAGIGVMQKCVRFILTVEYSLWNKTEREIAAFRIKTENSEFTDQVSIIALCEKEKYEKFADTVRDISNGKTEPLLLEEIYFPFERDC